MNGWVFVAAGAMCLLRGLRHHVRALVEVGDVRRCPGPNSFGVCDPTMGIATAKDEPCFSATHGVVTLVGEDYIHILGGQETVILMYQGLRPSVRAGQRVSPGQSIGASTGTLNFGVTAFAPDGTKSVDPASWLVSRGLRPVLSGKSALWCNVVREVAIPKDAREKCPLVLPSPAGFALFPVNIQTL
jgi:hypothetical protein